MEWDDEEVQKVKTCMIDWGVKSQTELMRVLVTQDYKRIVGSQVPVKKR
jgi:hypothetical protein